MSDQEHVDDALGVEHETAQLDGVRIDRHLRAFIERYVQRDMRARWIEFLIERREEWALATRSGAGVTGQDSPAPRCKFIK
jgi:hypothetical protein